jgi:hypothetical protein
VLESEVTRKYLDLREGERQRATGSRTVGLAGHVVYMRTMRNGYKVSAGRLTWKRPLGRQGRWKDKFQNGS